VRLVGRVEHRLTVGQDGLGLTEMDHSRGQQGGAGVAVLFVVPLEELLTEGTAVLNAAEAIREFRTVLHGAELAFRVRIVVGDIRPAVSLGDAQVGHHVGRLGSHHAAAVGMDVELAGRDLVLANGFFNKLLGQFGAFPMGHHPARDVAAEDVEHHVKIKAYLFTV